MEGRTFTNSLGVGQNVSVENVDWIFKTITLGSFLATPQASELKNYLYNVCGIAMGTKVKPRAPLYLFTFSLLLKGSLCVSVGLDSSILLTFTAFTPISPKTGPQLWESTSRKASASTPWWVIGYSPPAGWAWPLSQDPIKSPKFPLCLGVSGITSTETLWQGPTSKEQSGSHRRFTGLLATLEIIGQDSPKKENQ